MSLSSVVTDLEAQGLEDAATACLITSRSVSSEEKCQLLESVLGVDFSSEENKIDSGSKAFSTESGLALAQPQSIQEAVSAASACGGTVLFYVNPVDLSRGEGLFDYLGPVIEKILADKKEGTLCVVVDEEASAAKAKLELVAQSVLPSLIAKKSVSLLSDVFSSIVYIRPSEATEAAVSQNKVSTSDTLAVIQGASQASSMSMPDKISSDNLAAARVLGPAARLCVKEAVDVVKQASKGDDGTIKLVPNFGALCDAAISQATKALEEGGAAAPAVLGSAVGKQIRANLVTELDAELGVMFDEQLVLAEEFAFDQLKQGLSKLLVSPNLAADMEGQANKAFSTFVSVSKKLVAKKSTWTIQSAKQKFDARVKEHIASRLLAARAGGKFRPLPRKGVTVGMHWLLPKPFGNDFRQEPWMVHATDNMVYIPKDKISDVNPSEVVTGDWRDKVVPSPSGNDMIYMQ